MTKQLFPLVTPNDVSIDAMGRPNQCYFCRQKVGAPHNPNCSSVTKRVLVRYSFLLELEVPHHWTGDDLEAHRNDSSWCANSAVVEIAEEFGAEGRECACSSFECEYVDTVDATPRSRTREPDRSSN